jgi:hypothetical protein
LTLNFERAFEAERGEGRKTRNLNVNSSLMKDTKNEELNVSIDLVGLNELKLQNLLMMEGGR